MQMERQLRAGGGLMTLEEPRQGYFLGKIVKKAKRAVKKVVKSPLGKAAIIGGLGMYAGGLGPFAGLRGAGFAKPLLGSFASRLGPQATSGSGLLGLLGRGKSAFMNLPLGKKLLLGGGALATALPFFMGGDDDEEVVEEAPFSETPSSIADIVQQARNQDPSLRFLPEPKFVRNFYAANGGLADIPREGYSSGNTVMGDIAMSDPSETFKGMGTNIMDILKSLPPSLLEIFMNMKDSDKSDILEKLQLPENLADGGLAGRVPMQEGGIMDLGGMEKDYRTGGFVELGAEERADDVPARLSKNEFVFTADAVRNAGGGDIDRGAEVMQNMMDNLEAGGMISEESQGMNPAQEMFDQSQMLEGRLA
jgi:hypothetical protein